MVGLVQMLLEKSQQDKIDDLKTKLRRYEELHQENFGVRDDELRLRTAAHGYLEGILSCSEEMIITTDLESRIVKVSTGAERILGYTAEEIQGRDISELWVEVAERQKILDEVKTSEGVRNYETRLRTKAGEIVEISLTLCPVKDQWQGKLLGTVEVSKGLGREKVAKF
jgi:PAS domain S-box-containing protein